MITLSITTLGPWMIYARGLSRLSGHLDSSTPERVYQDPLNEVVLARAAKARRDMRQYVRGGNGNVKSPEANLARTYPRLIPPNPRTRKAPTA